MRLLLALLAGCAAWAQEPDIRVDVRLVNVSFSVVDAAGAFHPELDRADFEVFENGKKQTVRAFNKETELPLTLGILIDLSGSQRNNFRDNRDNALRFLRRVLRPEDRVFVMTFGRGVRLVMDETSSLRQVEATFAAFGAADQMAEVWSRRGGSPVHDAMQLAAIKKFRDKTGRKAMIVISDGDDNSSRTRASVLIERLQAVDTLVFALKTQSTRVVRKNGELILVPARSTSKLKQITEESGGRQFTTGTLDSHYEQIATELRTMYSIAYAPPQATPDGKFHKIEVRCVKRGMKVRHKAGYRAEA